MADGSKFEFGGNLKSPENANGGQGTVSGNSGSNGASERTNGGGGFSPEAHASPVRKRRGRPALPRDASGNIIRDGSSAANASGGGNASRAADAPKGAKLDLGKFKPNDRPGVRQQIQGMHAAVATLTKQPVFLLQDIEAESLTKALCDVLDYHEINLTEAGGAGALYLALGLTVFGIYKPRLDYIRTGGQMEIKGRATAPASPGEAKQQKAQGFTMDFTGDATAESVAH
jgi:hypothetical protein